VAGGAVGRPTPPDGGARARPGPDREFAWSRYEPARGRFDFGWLDEAIETLADAGLGVVLGTPTATPPVWLMRERPEILSVGPDGRRRAYGSRRHTSTTSRAYREEAARIVVRPGGALRPPPAVVAWQIDNEPGNHDSARCWSDESQSAFQAWLSRRFDGSIDALNDAWGTRSGRWTTRTFDAVRLPVPTVTDHNPSLEWRTWPSPPSRLPRVWPSSAPS
jgi:beta-galactosidase